MQKRKVILRADGNGEIGLGHISRCSALAEMLKNNFEIYFYTRCDSLTVLKGIKKYCSEVFTLNNMVSFEEEAKEWAKVLNGDEIVVLDGYNFNTDYQQKIKDKSSALVCIDDLPAYHFVADAVINHAPGIDLKQYSAEPYTKFYLGTEYVLLKEIFLKEAAEKNKNTNSKRSAILICLGGADPDNYTKQVLENVWQLFPDKKINVVTGAAYKHLADLQTTFSNKKNILIHANISSAAMLTIMKQSPVAITAASTIALEYCCKKGSLFLILTAENQKNLYQSLIEKKCAYAYEMLPQKRLSDEVVNNQYQLIDGRSNKRLLKIFNGFCEN